MKTQHENLGSDLTGQVIGAAIAVHREFGPGLDEADYERKDDRHYVINSVAI